MMFINIFLIIMGIIVLICLIILFFLGRSMDKLIELKFLVENDLVDFNVFETAEDVFNYNRYKKSGIPPLTNRLYKSLKREEKRAIEELENE